VWGGGGSQHTARSTDNLNYYASRVVHGWNEESAARILICYDHQTRSILLDPLQAKVRFVGGRGALLVQAQEL
jgi:hypothetical protein